MRRRTVTVFVLFGLVLILVACGQPTETSADPSTTEASQPPAPSTTATTPPTITPSATSTTYEIEVVKFAEAHGASLEEAAAVLYGQIAQGEALHRLYELVGEDVIVSAAFDTEFPHNDEVTIFVVDQAAVATVESRLAEAGLDLAKTTVEVASEEPPYDPWDWLAEEQFVGYDWLESPGPHPFGVWELVESNGVLPEVEITAGFASSWGLDQCNFGLGRALTSAEGTLEITIDEEVIDCGTDTGPVARQLLNVIEDNDGEFEVEGEADKMIWRGSAGGTLVWEVPEEYAEYSIPVYPIDRREALEAWNQSPAPDMEGIWRLEEVGGKDPAAPVSAFVGVSTIGFEGMCNDMQGLFAVTADGELGISGGLTAMDCVDSTTVVEGQITRVLFENQSVLRVSVVDDVMTWSNETGPQMVWSR